MKTVLIVEPVSSGWKLISKGKEFGFKVIVLTHNNDDRVIPDQFLKLADYVETVDTNNDEETLAKALEINKEYEIDAVVPGFEYYVPVASKINSKLGLRGLDPSTVYNLRFKDLMRQALKQDNLRSPKFTVISHIKQIDDAIKAVGFPCVIKPVDCSGSLNVRKVTNKQELIDGFKAIDITVITDLGRVARRDVLIEEYISGKEYSIEGFVENGEVFFLSITEKMLAPEPYFVEIGHIVSAQLEPQKKETIYEYVKQVIKTLNVSLGPFHCEIRLTNNGPVLMEIGARLPGDRICDLIYYAKEVDLYRIMFNSYLGLTNSLASIDSTNSKVAGIKFFIVPGLRNYSSINGLQRIREEDGFKELQISHPPNVEIPEPTSFMGRIGYAIFAKDTYHDLNQILNKLDHYLTFN